MYITRTGCQWRNLPLNFPKWRAVNYYFERWKRESTLIAMNDMLNMEDRIGEGRKGHSFSLMR